MGDLDEDKGEAGAGTQPKKHAQTSAGISRAGSAARDSSENPAAGDTDDGPTEEARALPPDVGGDVRGDAGGAARKNSPSTRSSKGSSPSSLSGGSRKKKPRASSADDLADLEMREARPTPAGG